MSDTAFMPETPASRTLTQLALLIAQAEAEKKWLWCHYQDLWFSPAQLRAKNAAGKFIWGVVNWTLRDPQERVEEANRRASLTNAEAARITEQVKAER